MIDVRTAEATLSELRRRYGKRGISYARLLELLSTCVFNENNARGPTAAFHHDLVVVLLEMEKRWTHRGP